MTRADYPHEADRRLWMAVILQAIKDYYYGDHNVRDNAKYWIFNKMRKDNRSFTAICEEFDLSPTLIRDRLIVSRTYAGFIGRGGVD